MERTGVVGDLWAFCILLVNSAIPITAGASSLIASGPAAPPLSSTSGESVSSIGFGFATPVEGIGGVALEEGARSLVVIPGPRFWIRSIVVLAMMRIISMSPREQGVISSVIVRKKCLKQVVC